MDGKFDIELPAEFIDARHRARQSAAASSASSASSSSPDTRDALHPHNGDSTASVLGADEVWHVADFQPGDCVVFDIRCVHASTRNLSGHLRLSVDTRWKPVPRMHQANASGASSALDPGFVSRAEAQSGREHSSGSTL
jgi:hypothetical protein